MDLRLPKKYQVFGQTIRRKCQFWQAHIHDVINLNIYIYPYICIYTYIYIHTYVYIYMYIYLYNIHRYIPYSFGWIMLNKHVRRWKLTCLLVCTNDDLRMKGLASNGRSTIFWPFTVINGFTMIWDLSYRSHNPSHNC